MDLLPGYYRAVFSASCNNIAGREKYQRFFLLSGQKNLFILFNAKIEGGVGRIFFFTMFIQTIAADRHVGGIRGRGEGNGGDLSITK